MHESVRNALKDAIAKSLSVLQPMTSQFTEPFLVWSKSGDQSWRGEEKDQPSLTQIFLVSYKFLEETGSEFLQLFRKHYPEYGNLIGFSSLGQMNVVHDSAYILGKVIAELWSRHRTLECDADAIETVVQEFEDFIDLPKVRFRCAAELLNYRMDPQGIDFAGNMIIRHLSDKETNEYYGGPMRQLGWMSRGTIGISDCVLETEYEEPKLFGNQQSEITFVQSQVGLNLERAVLALRTFKEGGIGLGSVRFKSVKFCPVPFPSLRFGLQTLPGTYHISEQETESLQRHATLIFSTTEPAMEMACSRLSDAQTRLRAQDRLVDAVIGLEALLLAGLDTEARRGELRYRFALHYSTLFATPEERYRSFRTARDLYDLRSTIAHGGKVAEENCRAGDETLTLQKAAHRACELLRGVIKHFLPQTATAPYKNPQYWESSYFGLKS